MPYTRPFSNTDMSSSALYLHQNLVRQIWYEIYMLMQGIPEVYSIDITLCSTKLVCKYLLRN